MSPFMLGFLAGMFVGAWIGFIVLALCVAARETEDERRAFNEHNVGGRQNHGGER
jgi:hypothetical protein